MFRRVLSAAITGVQAYEVSVEADISDGLPAFEMVGFLGSEVKEAKERVRTSLKNSGYHLTPKKITVNLSPADIRKEGTNFDLPIAVAILSSYGYIPQENLRNIVIIGELSLDGSIRRVNGVLPIASLAKEKQTDICFVPKLNAREGAVVEGVKIVGVSTLSELVTLLNDPQLVEPEYVESGILFSQDLKNNYDMQDIGGQETVKRATEIAVAGMHNLLYIGAPGSGKTMMAKRIPTIQPHLTMEESIEITKIYSVTGLLSSGVLMTERPFRAPHHTISIQALTGGGRNPKPGEITLAHKGVLFLDELPEFRKAAIEALRQPMEDRKVTISRLTGSYEFPTDFMLVAAMNPCNCGYYPDRNICHCNEYEVNRYLNKISRPLLDRIDVCVDTPRVEYHDLLKHGRSESSATIRERVELARVIQSKRYRDESFQYNASIPMNDIKKYCSLDTEAEKLMEHAFQKLNLSARAYHKIIKVARTIADLAGREDINALHISEAIAFRTADYKYWMGQK